MSDPNTPGEAAYRAWLISLGGPRESDIPFDQLREHDRKRWHAIADAVIYHARSIITEEMVKAANVATQRPEAQ